MEDRRYQGITYMYLDVPIESGCCEYQLNFADFESLLMAIRRKDFIF